MGVVEEEELGEGGVPEVFRTSARKSRPANAGCALGPPGPLPLPNPKLDVKRCSIDVSHSYHISISYKTSRWASKKLQRLLIVAYQIYVSELLSFMIA